MRYHISQGIWAHRTIRTKVLDKAYWEGFMTTKAVIYDEKDVHTIEKEKWIIFQLPKAAYPYRFFAVDKIFINQDSDASCTNCSSALPHKCVTCDADPGGNGWDCFLQCDDCNKNTPATPCDACNGSGGDNRAACRACHGTGHVLRR